MLAAIGAWVGLLSALAGIVLVWLRARAVSRPERKAKEARDENAQVARDVRAGDADAVNRRLRRWRDEDD